MLFFKSLESFQDLVTAGLDGDARSSDFRTQSTLDRGDCPLIWFYVAGWIVCFWIVFFSGAEKLERTFLGYFEFGQFADGSKYMRMAAALGLAIIPALILMSF